MVSYHLPAYIRVSIGTPEQNARFLAELPAALEGLVEFKPLPSLVAVALRATESGESVSEIPVARSATATTEASAPAAGGPDNSLSGSPEATGGHLETSALPTDTPVAASETPTKET